MIPEEIPTAMAIPIEHRPDPRFPEAAAELAHQTQIQILFRLRSTALKSPEDAPPPLPQTRP